MSEQAWHEQGLRDAALAGDAEAWRVLVEKHQAAVRRYLAWRLGGCVATLDDLAQESWLIAARSLRKFAPSRGTFQHWLFGIAANVCRNHLRSRRRSKQRPLPDGHEPSEKKAEDQQAERVADALAELPDHYERLLRTKYFEGASVECIAESEKQSAKAIESLLTRARTAFRELYEKDSP
ncbi:MAG TPA: RNA polymerase sigma factor [Gemmatales bacterium]|nr:RNA polymerase sigma factor [Gemmatales bacterium]